MLLARKEVKLAAEDNLFRFLAFLFVPTRIMWIQKLSTEIISTISIKSFYFVFGYPK